MQLTADQRKEFDERGYIFFPSLFSGEEVAVLRDAAQRVMQREGPEVVRGIHSDAVQLVYGAHQYDQTFRRLGRHPRLISLAEQLLGNKVYVHQSRLNPKVAFEGEVWAWHQDFATWNDRDGLMKPRAMMVAVFLDDATDVNAPLLIIPGSHRHGLIHEAVDNRAEGGYTLFVITPESIARLAADVGIKAVTGPAGSMLISHCNIVHGSSTNITPWPRTIFYLNVAAIDNPPTNFQRAEHHCTRNYSAIETLGDDCLLQTASETS